MTNNNDDLTRQLGRELHHQVDGMSAAPVSLSDVKGTATRIRRRRAAVAGGAVAAAVAILVPTAMLAGGGFNRADNDNSPATTTPSATASASNAKATEHRLDPDAPMGDPAALAMLDGRTLIHADGARETLPAAYQQFALLGDRVLGVRSDDDGNRVMDIVEDGSVTESVPVTSMVISPNGLSAAWSTPEGEVVTMWEGGRRSLAKLGAGFLVAIQGEGSCVPGEATDIGCSVFYNVAGEGQPRVAAADGSNDVVAPDYIKLDAVANRGSSATQSAGQISSHDAGSCNKAYGQDQSTVRIETCEFSFLRFSPDDKLLLATDDYRDGFGPRILNVLDSYTGAPRVTFSDGDTVLDQKWEDNEHLLVVTYGESGWNVLRLGLDGSIERVVEPNTTADDTSRPFVLEGNP